MSNKHGRRYYDVWSSDSNNRYCLGTVDVRRRSSQSADSWYALDKAISAFAKNGKEWERLYMDPIAVYDFHPDQCECDCHQFEHEKGCEQDNDCECNSYFPDGCEECWESESLGLEACDGHRHAGQHSCQHSDDCECNYARRVSA